MQSRNTKSSEFARMHPVIIALFLMGVMLITMLTLNPWILCGSFLISFLYERMLCGSKIWLTNLWIQIPVLVFTIGIQPIFSHSGLTILFYINDNPVTKEAYVYGMVIGLLLVSVIQWCVCLNQLIESDKLMYLLGKRFPSIGLMISMVIRFVPLLQQRFHEIHEAQVGLGNHGENQGIFAKMSQYTKEVSILISWSLESSVETSASMEARGYGLRGRTSYHRFQWKRNDKKAAIYLVIFLIIALSEILTGAVTTYYLPRIIFATRNATSVITIVAFYLFAIYPLMIDWKGALRWKLSDAKI